ASLYESDFAPIKPYCDVLLSGSAYASNGTPTERVRVSLRVASMAKSFDVVGNRTWRVGALLYSPSRIEPFVRMRISYNNAFGGIDQTNPEAIQFYPANHVGVGFHADTSERSMGGRPLPNTEEVGKPVSSPHGRYKPMAFGP